MIVPPYRATLGVPYCASPPKVCDGVRQLLPKFHTHEVGARPDREDCGLSDQNG